MSTIKLKRSAVEGKVPLAEDLELGELAINTTDGKLYLKKSVAGANSIVDVTAGTGQSATELLNQIKTVDGAGSGLDADLLDGANGTFYLDYTNFTNTPSIPSSGVDFDPVGTDNSTDVTLAGAYDYLTISGQQITLGQIDYTTDINNTPTIGDANISFSGDQVIEVTNSFSLNDTLDTEILLSVNTAAISITEDQITDLQSYLTSETVTSLSLATNILTYTDETGANTDIDLSLYLDDTNLARLVSGTVAANGVATFTRDDTSTFTVDFSVLFDDTNLARITSAGFNSANGVITLTRDDASTLTVDISTVDADKLDGQEGSYYLNYANFTNTPTLYTSANFDTDFAAKSTTNLSEGTNLYYTEARANTAIDARVTQTFVNALNIDADRVDGFHGSYYLDFTNFTNVPDPNIVVTLTGDVTGTANTTLTNLANGSISITTTIADDSHNHVISNIDGLQTALDAKADETITISAGSGLSGGGNLTANRTISHADTSTQASVNNSDGTVIQDVTLDTFGHVTGLASANLDLRYLQSESDTLDSVTSRGASTVNDITVGSVQISSDSKHESANATLTTTSATTVYQFANATYSGSKIVVQARDSVSGEVQISELLIVQDGTTASATEYGIVYTGLSPIATYNVSISGGNTILQATSASTNSTVYRILSTLMLS